MGFDTTHVPTCYQNWAAAALPATLPDALQALYAAKEAGAAGAVAAPAAGAEDWSVLMPVMTGAANTVQQVLAQQRGVFGDLVQQLSSHKEAKPIHAEPDDMSVDVCFCIDVTGSMSGWIEACKAQISAICKGLMPKIQKKCPDVDVKVRWSLVAYRDYGDADQLQVLDFTEDPQQLEHKVGSASLAQVQGQFSSPGPCLHWVYVEFRHRALSTAPVVWNIQAHTLGATRRRRRNRPLQLSLPCKHKTLNVVMKPPPKHQGARGRPAVHPSVACVQLDAIVHLLTSCCLHGGAALPGCCITRR